MSSKIYLCGDTYKIKQTQGHNFTDNTQVERITMMVTETQTSFTIPETQKSPELTFAIFQEAQKTSGISMEVPHTPKRALKPSEKDTKHNFTSFRIIFMKELEAIKDFTKSFE